MKDVQYSHVLNPLSANISSKVKVTLCERTHIAFWLRRPLSLSNFTHLKSSMEENNIDEYIEFCNVKYSSP